MSTTSVSVATAYAPASPGSAAVAETRSAARLRSIDVLRGAVMLLMAIDHVRVYAGVPPGGPEPGVFFTRWVTHFCAPVFIFLAGTSAWLYGERIGDRAPLARWLAVRGALLVLLELTVLRFFWTFNFDYREFTFAGVIWVIGWSMLGLAALVRLPVRAIAAFGLATIVGHNLLGMALPAIRPAAEAEGWSWLLQLLYAGGPFRIGGEGGVQVAVLYALVPWIGVMAAGFAFGPVMRLDRARRDRICLALGASAVALFVLLRATGVYGDPRPWETGRMPALLAFLSTTKYPASLQFLLMTLGPMLLLVPWLERASNRVTEWVAVFGRVPFFYYVLHIPLIHLVALGIAMARTPDATWWLFANHPYLPPDVPEGYRWSLSLLYAVTAAVIVALYLPCRWYARLKARRPDLVALRYL